jgi:hypothetical protein
MIQRLDPESIKPADVAWINARSDKVGKVRRTQ